MTSAVASVDKAFLFIFSSIGIIMLFLTTLIVWFAIRYRRKRNPVATQIRGHTGLEIVWTLLPLGLALVMFWYGWESYLGLRNVPEGAMAVEVEGKKFAWVFSYEGGKVSDNVLLVPEGKPIRLNIHSKDVLHGFSIPAFRVKVDAIPGRQTYGWFMADRLGDYDIFCSSHCGAGHAEMVGKLRIVTAEEFKKWVAETDDF